LAFGEFGGASELSWEFLAPAWQALHVVAPDWLGFGARQGLRLCRRAEPGDDHMARFLQVMAIDKADFVGNSMGGSNLARIACTQQSDFPIRSIVLCSGGGFAPTTNRARAAELRLQRGAMKAAERDVPHHEAGRRCAT